ncbi:MAG: efflux RND transporter periplasmic adaptor subunit [Selenomonadaceae bacterium]|nr:efflux RND transporter periplasmic adaptor subunit [Selenomonadaceae bacterium]
MKRYFFISLVVVLVIVVGFVSYGAYLNKAGENAIAERMAERMIPLQGSKAQIRKINPKIFLDTINVYSNEMTDAIALIDGRVSTVNVQKNDQVSKGQILFNLTNEQYPLKIRQAEIDILKADSEILKAQNDIVKAETYLARAKNDFGRYSRLRDKDAVTVERYDEAEAAYKEAQVNLEVAHVQKDQMIAQKESLIAQKDQLLMESSHSQVSAPIDGEVLILYRQIGSYVTAGTPLALIGDFNHLYFTMTVEDETAKSLSVGQVSQLNFNRRDLTKVYDTDYNVGNAGKEQTFTAKIIDISPAISEPAAMRTILWEINNSAGLLEPQTYNGVSIQSLVSKSCLAVPLSAMIDHSHSTVFVLSSDNILEKREVIAGTDDGNYIEIRSGLNEGDIVITSGMDGLESGMKANVKLEERDN